MSEALAKLYQFGYGFNNGQLCKVDKKTNKISDEPFEFDVFGDQNKNQEHYEKLAELIPDIVYDLLEKNGLSRIYIPEHLPRRESTFIFVQPPLLDKSEKLIVLIHGSGFVRAGQWARRLIINNSLDHGTQLPYIKRAQELNYDIIVMNTNDNHRFVNGERKSIPELSTPTEHATYVWKNFVMATNPSNVAIVAHSYGGTIAMDLANKFPSFFEEKVFAVALTDSAHFNVPKNVKTVLSNITCNWVASFEPVDKTIRRSTGEIRQVSAGHPNHEWTSWSAFESVFKFLEEKYADKE